MTWDENEQMGIEFVNVSPVHLLGAAGFLEWQAYAQLDMNAARAAAGERRIITADHLGPGGRIRQ